MDTADPDELVAGLASRFGPVKLDMLGRNAKLQCKLKITRFGLLSIVNGTYGSGFKVSFADFNSYAGSAGPLRGMGVHNIEGQTYEVRRGSGIAISPGAVSLHYGPHFEHLSIAIPPSVLAARLSAIIDGEMCLGPLRFSPATNGRTGPSQRLNRLLRFLAIEVGNPYPIPSIVLVELQDAVSTSFLLANRSNYSGRMESEPAMAAPWQVDSAEQFIEANWDKPITIEALANATNVSVRSLFSAFKRGRGYTPMEFVKRVRLERARQALAAADDRSSVATVAFACGFGNAGHFAVDYRRRFGESPSDTLRRGRSG